VKAIRVRKRGGVTAHWLLDPGRTYCGKRPADLDVVDELDLDELHPVEACGSCQRVQAGWSKPERERAATVTAESRPPRVYRVGPLQHGRDMR
jgi:hypothetical protein